MTRIRLAKRAIFAANRTMILIFVFAGLLEHCVASHLGSKCQHDMDCTDFIKGSTCSMNGYCECAPYFVQYNVTTCLSSQLLGGDCILADQCTMKVANSSCLDGACRCVEGFLQFRKHTCLGPAHPGAVCYSHAHCQMNDKRSHCDFLIPNLFGRCQCTAPAKQYGGTCVGADENAIENDATDSQTTAYVPKITPPTTVFRPIDLISHYESTTQGKPLNIVEEIILPAVTEIPQLPELMTSGSSSEHAGGEDLTSNNESLDVLGDFQVTSSTSAPSELVQQAAISDDYPYQIDNEEQVDEQPAVVEVKPDETDESHGLPEKDHEPELEPINEIQTIGNDIPSEGPELDKEQSPTEDSNAEQEPALIVELQREDIKNDDQLPPEQQPAGNDAPIQEQFNPEIVTESYVDENQAEIETKPLEIQLAQDNEQTPDAVEEEVVSQTQQPVISDQHLEENPDAGNAPENVDESLKEPVYIEESHSRPSSGMHIPEEASIVDEEAEAHIDMYGEMASGNSQENKDLPPVEEEVGSGDSQTSEPVKEAEGDSFNPHQQKVTIQFEQDLDKLEEPASETPPDLVPDTNEEQDHEDQEQTTQKTVESQTIMNENIESVNREDNNQFQEQENNPQASESEAEPIEQEHPQPEDVEIEQNLREELALPGPEEHTVSENEAPAAVAINEDQNPDFEKVIRVEENPQVLPETYEEGKPGDELVVEESSELPVLQVEHDQGHVEAESVQEEIIPEHEQVIQESYGDLQQKVLETDHAIIEDQETTTQASAVDLEKNTEAETLATLEGNEEEKENVQKQELAPQLQSQDQTTEVQPIQEAPGTVVDQESAQEIEQQTEQAEQASEELLQETNIAELAEDAQPSMQSEEEHNTPEKPSPAPTQELVQESAPETESDREQETLPILLQDVLSEQSQEIAQQPIRKFPKESEQLEEIVPVQEGHSELSKPNLLELSVESDQPLNKPPASDEAISQENHLPESGESIITSPEHVEPIKSESSEEFIQQVHDIEHGATQIVNDNNPLAANDHMPNETLLTQITVDKKLAPEEEPISTGENDIMELGEKIESDASLGASPMPSSSVSQTPIDAQSETEIKIENETQTQAQPIREDEDTTAKVEIEPQLADTIAHFEIEQNADHAPITEAPTPVHQAFDVEDEQTVAGAATNVDTSTNEPQTGVNGNERETTESVPLEIESETLATPKSESDYSEIEKFEQFEDHHLVEESPELEPEPEQVHSEWELKLPVESEVQETTIDPLADAANEVKRDDDVKAEENPQFNESESVLSILSGLMADESGEGRVTTISPEHSIDDLNAEGTANNEQTPAGNLYYPTILSELLLPDSSEESNAEDATTPIPLLEKNDTSAQTVSPDELPFDLSFVSTSDREELMSDNLVVETTPQPEGYRNDDKVTTELPNILEITTQTMLGLASRVTLMEPAAPIVTTLKPYMPVEDEFSTTPSSQMSTESFLNSKQEIRKRVELGNGPVSLGLRCNNDRQCQLADPYTVCNEQGLCDCASKRSPQAQCSAERTGCSSGTFQCRSSGVCISWFFVCDGRPDCTDASDEECTFNARLNQTCPSEAFRCEHSGRCISRAALCDGRKQCPHGEDEIECDSLRTESGQCPPNTFRCNSGECLPEYEYCNAIISCKDGSDEPPHLCGSRSVPNIFLRLLTAAVVDGGTSSTTTSSDSSRTNAYCPHRCSNGRCRSTAIVCSGRDGCGDGTDEETCSVCRCPVPAYISAPPADILAHQSPMPLWK